MVNILVLLFHLIGTAGSDGFYSIRLQGLGTELAGIVSDEETDALLYPAQVPSYTNRISSVSSINGLSLFFLAPCRLSIGGLASAELDITKPNYHTSLSSFSSALTLACLPRPATGLGLVSQYHQSKYDYQEGQNSSNYSSQDFSVSLGSFRSWGKWKFDNTILIQNFRERELVFVEEYYDTSNYRFEDIKINSEWIASQFHLRLSFTPQNNWSWRFAIAPNFHWRKSDIDSLVIASRVTSSDTIITQVDTTYSTETYGFSDFNFKFGLEWLSTDLNIASALSLSHMLSKDSFSVSLPLGIEYFAGHFVFRLGLGARYEKHFTDQDLENFFSVGFGFLPNNWLRIDFLTSRYYGISSFHDWNTEVKIIW